MKRFFKKKSKPYYLRSQKHLYASTPRSKTDASVSCDLPFDESEIAPELRQEKSSVDTPDSRCGEEKSPSANGTNLEAVDISIEEGVNENRNQESIYNKTLDKGKEKERSKKDLEETVFTTGGLREPVINSPADIYKHFPRRVIFEDELWERFSETESSSSEEIGSRENVTDSDDQVSDDNAARLFSNTQKAGTSRQSTTAENMFSQETPEKQQLSYCIHISKH